jgi:hypothetical protein
MKCCFSKLLKMCVPRKPSYCNSTLKYVRLCVCMYYYYYYYYYMEEENENGFHQLYLQNINLYTFSHLNFDLC